MSSEKKLACWQSARRSLFPLCYLIALRQQKIIVCHDMVLFLKTFVVPGVLFRSKQVCLFCSEQVWLILQIIYFENVPHNVVLKAFLVSSHYGATQAHQDK